MHACKTGHGSDARVVSDRGALSVELKGGKPTKDDEAWLGFGREGGNAGDEGFAGARSALPRHSTTVVHEAIARCRTGMSTALPMVMVPSLETFEAPMA